MVGHLAALAAGHRFFGRRGRDVPLLFVPIYAKDQVGKAVKESLARLVSSHSFEE
jgi:hypothetical protein